MRQLLYTLLFSALTVFMIWLNRQPLDQSIPEDWHVTALRPGVFSVIMDRPDAIKPDMSSPFRYLSRSVKVGEEFRVLGYFENKTLWVESANGERGMIDQITVADTVVCKLPVPNKFNAGATLKVIGKEVTKNGMILIETMDGNQLEVRVNCLKLKSLIAHHMYQVKRAGWGYTTRERFEKQVIGKNIAHLDTTFAPVLFLGGGNAVISRRIYVKEKGGMYLATLRLDDNGTVLPQIEYGVMKESFGAPRNWLLMLKGSNYVLENVSKFTGDRLYHAPMEDADLYIKMQLGMSLETPYRTGWRKTTTKILKVIAWPIKWGLILFGWMWYYWVTPCFIFLMLWVLSLSPWPFKPMSNEVLRYFLKFVLIASLYWALLCTVANFDLPMYYSLPGFITVAWVLFKMTDLLIEFRCPTCKNAFRFYYIDTDWQKSTVETEQRTRSRSHTDLTGTTKHFTKVKNLDDGTETEEDVSYTDHYKTITRYDYYTVFFRVTRGIENWRCEKCGELLLRKTEERQKLGESLDGSENVEQDHDRHRDI